MRKFLLVLVVLGALAAIIYLVGTKSGRARRDDLVARARRSSEGGAVPDIDLRETASEVEESSAELADNVGSALGTPS